MITFQEALIRTLFLTEVLAAVVAAFERQASSMRLRFGLRDG